MVHDTLDIQSTRAPLAKATSIGVFGGTFDPIHIGHLILAEYARDFLDLDAILFIPALIPPHKQSTRSISGAEHRIAMIELGIASNPYFHSDTFEIEHNRVSYTVETLRYLRSTYPGAALSLLIGSDNLNDFPQWHEPGEILDMATIAVWDRRDHYCSADFEYALVAAPIIDVSGTEIRARVQEGKSIRYLTRQPVVEYIERHGLYL